MCKPSSKQSRGQVSGDVHEESETSVSIIYTRSRFSTFETDLGIDETL